MMTHSFPKGLPSFYSNVYKMVDDPSSDAIISWGESDNTFIIRDLKGLFGEILPKYVGLGKRFIPELLYHGFERVKGTGQLEFGHGNFVRGKPHLLKKMFLQVSVQRMAKMGADLQLKISQTKAMIARAEARNDRVKVEKILQDMKGCIWGSCCTALDSGAQLCNHMDDGVIINRFSISETNPVQN